VSVLGASERNLKMIREALGVRLTPRGQGVHVAGGKGAVLAARKVLEQLGEAAAESTGLSRQQVLDLIANEATEAGLDGREVEGEDLLNGAAGGTVGGLEGDGWDGRLAVYAAGRAVRPKTANQEFYLKAISENDLVVATGPAGTGKTYLAVAAAVHLLKSGRVKKMILVRPAVEAGEKLGFLPGDLEAKVNPYLRPLFDALGDMMDYHTVRRFMDSDVVEVVPLAFMRGRTLNNAVIILDEAQNTTRGQMKMFLTRMGHGSKTIVTGDTTQIDLPDPRESGLIDAARRLRRVRGVAFAALDRTDVVRHPLVQRIVDAYGEEETKRRSAEETEREGEGEVVGLETDQ
jgi:phosphate starvation-inducible PhoH-like protein